MLEQIAKDTKDILGEIKVDIRGLREEQKSDFRWLIGLLIGLAGFTIAGFTGLLATMAHGFHWL